VVSKDSKPNTVNRKEVISMKIYMTQEASDKMFAYAKRCSIEISGLGTVEIVDGCPVITDVFLLKQECSGATTNIDDTALGDMYMKMAEEGKKEFNIRLWWHSHVGGGCYWSGTDTSTIERFLGTSSWFLSIVVNNKGEYRARVDYYKPFRVELDNVDVEILRDKMSEDEMEQIDKEIEDNVSRVSHIEQYAGRSYYGGHDWYTDYRGVDKRVNAIETVETSDERFSYDKAWSEFEASEEYDDNDFHSWLEKYYPDR